MILPKLRVAYPPTTTEWRSCISGLMNPIFAVIHFTKFIARAG